MIELRYECVMSKFAMDIPYITSRLIKFMTWTRQQGRSYSIGTVLYRFQDHLKYIMGKTSWKLEGVFYCNLF